MEILWPDFQSSGILLAEVFLDVGSPVCAAEGTCSAPHEGLNDLSSRWSALGRAHNVLLISVRRADDLWPLHALSPAV